MYAMVAHQMVALVVACFTHLAFGARTKHGSARRAAAAEGTDLQRMNVSAFTMRAATAEERDTFVNIHNKYRCMHGVDPVVWNDAVAEDANIYISPRTSMAHSRAYSLKPPAGPAGENLYWSSGPGSAEQAVTMWYSEVNDCKGGPSFTDGCANGVEGRAVGHFTAMIWKGVKSIGCAFSNSRSPTVIICRYKAGDMLDNDTPNMNKRSGNYIKHVFPRSRQEAECASGSTSQSAGQSVGEEIGTQTLAAPAVSGGIDYEHCIPEGSRQKCETCTHSSQCVGNDYCCPMMKKCVGSGTSCFLPIAKCDPPCHERDSGAICRCGDKAYPTTWLGKECATATPTPSSTSTDDGNADEAPTGNGDESDKAEPMRSDTTHYDISRIVQLWLCALLRLYM